MTSHLDAAIAFHRGGDVGAARDAAREGLAEHPHDVPLLHFLGMMELRAGDVPAARAWLEQALAAEPAGPPLVSLARLYAQSSDWAALAALDVGVPPGAIGDEYLMLRAKAFEKVANLNGVAGALAALMDRRPQDRQIALAAARALAEAGDLAGAEVIYRDVLAKAPCNEQALLGMTGLLESLGRSADLKPYFEAARRAGSGRAILALGEAITRRERGDFVGALSAIEQAPGLLPSATWHQMRGGLADRADAPDTAYAAFGLMNAADAAAQPDAQWGSQRFRSSVDAALAELDGAGIIFPPGHRPPPLFLLGFPRSGTTLLDTFLMGHPGVQVHEERPFLERAAAAAFSTEGAPPSAVDVERMRATYWDALDGETSRSGVLQIDKFPLASARALLIHRLFPDARFIFSVRHPCDVVLSCFMTRFRLNWGVASFLSLEDAADLYVRTMRLWVAARARLELNVLEVRYEHLISQPADVIRKVVHFAGLEDFTAMLDHQSTARSRGMITTPSFAQVLEPLTGRAVGRWKRYRDHLQPILPLLAPWCEKFGYSIDE